MDGAPAADRRTRLLLLRGLSDPAQPELLVDVRRHPDLHARRADRHRHRAGDALHAACRPRLQFCRAHHARRELRLAAALRARQRRLDVLPRGVHPHVPRHVLRLLQGTARGAVDPRRHPAAADDRHRLHGLRAAVGADELLGRDRDHQPVLGHPARWRNHRHLAVGRLFGRQPDAQSLLIAALPLAVRDRRRGGAAHLGAARGRAEQPNRRRAEIAQGHGRVHALCHHQGHVFDGVLLPAVRLVRVLPAELHGSRRQLHPGQPGGDADPHCARVVLPAVLRHPARDPEQARRRDRARRLDRDPRLPAVARHLEGALRQLPAAVPAILLDLRGRLRGPGMARIEARRGRLRHRRAHSHLLLLPPLPRHPADPWLDREDQAAAELDLGVDPARGFAARRVGPGAHCSQRLGARSMSRPFLALLLAGAVAGLVGIAPSAAAEDTPQPPRQKWSFAGPFGTYDRAQLQRGFKVYREVCSVCHGLNLLSFRNLGQPGALGYSEAQVKQLASEYKVQDGPNDQGEMFEREGRPADRFPPPFPNENAARARYNAVPPDMSVIAKARTYDSGFPWFVLNFFTQYQEQGVDYITALLMGYEDKPPAGVTIPSGLSYNKYFPGHAI